MPSICWAEEQIEGIAPSYIILVQISPPPADNAPNSPGIHHKV